MKKVLVIGLDGATFDIIKPLVKKGKLPTIAKLMKEGVHGKLKSTIPPASIPAWPSFMTGVNPAKHGCFDFMKRHKNEYYGRLITSEDIKVPTLWKILSEFGKKSIVINVTGTYPPEKINGIIISGFLTPKGKNFVYPFTLQKEIEEKGYRIFVDDDVLKASDEALFLELCKLEEKRVEVALHLMKRYEWDFFMIMIIGTDTIQHMLWNNKDLIFRYYEKMDELISKIIENIEKDKTNIFIISDHGFGELKKIVHINKWLHDLGLLAYRRVDISSTREFKIKSLKGERISWAKYGILLSKLGITQENIVQVFGKFTVLRAIYRFLPKKVKKLFHELPKTNLDIDWSNTKAFLASFFGTETQGIMINLKGREPQGIVDPSEYDRLREYIISKLKELKDPETGEKIFENVFKKEEIYTGPYINEAPDIVTLLKGEYKFSADLKAKEIITPLNKIQGSHRLYGIFIAYGPDIKQDITIENAQIIDLAPTILHIFDIPIPKYMDGKVLKEIFKEESDCAKRKIKYQKIKIEEKMKIKTKIRYLKKIGKI